MDDRPLSELFRLASKEWVDLDNAARLLEENKDIVLNELVLKCGDVPVAHAERDVKASKAWREYIASKVEARTKANRAKQKLKWIEMRHAEKQSAEASKRAEMRL